MWLWSAGSGHTHRVFCFGHDLLYHQCVRTNTARPKDVAGCADQGRRTKDQHALCPSSLVFGLRHVSNVLYTLGGGLGATPGTLWVWARGRPQTPTVGEVWRGPTTLWVPPPHLPNCQADCARIEPCLSPQSQILPLAFFALLAVCIFHKW